MPESAAPISIKEKVGYALGDTASCLYYQSFALFLMIFYTDTFGLAPAAVGTMFLVTRIWDTAFDPLMGVIADRTETRHGKFRPWILWSIVPLSISGVAVFVTPGFGPTGKLVWAYFTYTLVMMAYSAINVPYGALLGVISPSSEERTKLSSYRFLGAFSGNMIVQAGLLWLVSRLGGGNDQVGYPLAFACFAALGAGMFLFTFAATKERVRPPAERSELKADLKDLLRNRPWVVLSLVGVMSLVYISIKSAAMMYYFKYYVGEEFRISGSQMRAAIAVAAVLLGVFLVKTAWAKGFAVLARNLGLAIIGVTVAVAYSRDLALRGADNVSTFLVTGTMASLVGVSATPYLVKFLRGKKLSFVGLTVMTAITTGAFGLAGPNDFVLMYAMNLVGSFFGGTLFPLMWAMYADTADYGEWKFNRRATGLVFSAATFSQKMGWSLGSWIAGLTLASYGYAANATQTAETLGGIRAMMSWIPASLCLFVAAFAVFYNLDGKTQARIEADLGERRKSTAAPAKLEAA